MNEEIDFKGMWTRQESNPPGKDELLVRMNRLKGSHLRKIILVNVLLVVTSSFLIFVWAQYQPQFLTTKAGLVIIILAMIIFVAAYSRTLPLLKESGKSESVKEYLQNILAIKERQQFLQTTMLNLYLSMFSIGICLYMYEYALRMSIWMAMVVYLVTLSWIAFNWFFIRPRQIKKQNAKINDLINRFESINRQLKE